VAVATREPSAVVLPLRAARRDLGEVRWLLAAAAVLVVLCAVPDVVSAAFGPPDLVRSGSFWFVRDTSQYQAAMREGASSTSWLIHNRFTAETHDPVLIYPLYAGLGTLSAAAGVDPRLVFNAAEWLGRLSLLGALYAFAATFLTDIRQRHLAVALAAATLGLAALALTRSAPINVYLEMSSFGVFLSAPHLMLGLALTLLVAPLYLRARDGDPGALGLLGADVLALSLVHPFNLPVVVSVLVVDAVLGRGCGWQAALVAVVAAAPMTLYNFFLFQLDPFWAGTYGVQNRMPAPMPWELPVDFGLVLIAAPLAWTGVRMWPPDRRRLLLLWIALGLVWLYAPVPFQRRFAFGVQPGLAILAASGLFALNGWMRGRDWGAVRRRVVNYTLALAAVSTAGLVYVSVVASAALNAPAEVYLLTRWEAAAAGWLAEHASADDVVLASTEFANPLVGLFDGRVVHGHIVATRASETKQALVRRFFGADASVVERSRLLRESGASIVAFGPRERALGATDLAGQPELEWVHDAGGVSLFRVRGARN
jgi:hypothetical protein